MSTVTVITVNGRTSSVGTSVHRLISTSLRGAPGSPGGGGGSSGFSFTQSTSSAVWTINHNLGYRPNVALFTVGGVNFNGEVSHPTVNQTIVSLSSPLAGSARLS